MMRAQHAVMAATLLVQPAAPEEAPRDAIAPESPAHTATASRVDVSFSIHCEEPTHAISPLVYGISLQPMHDTPGEWQLGATARRWGGNHTTRYNWKLGNAWNSGKDWFFRNADFYGQQAPAYERFIDDDLAHDVATALTVPTIGWVAKDTTSYGFPVAIYGPQRARAPENGDSGDGVAPWGSLIAPRGPEQTSVAMPPSGVGDWVRAIRARDELRGKRSVHTYILDNEPMLWNETHRDVHPEPVSYDELLERTIAYAGEIRRADPGGLIAGPAEWGWPAYFESAVDHARLGSPDRAAHGGVPLLPWWLREVRAEENRSGHKLIDLVDVHFYPQGRGIGLGTAGAIDADTAARRIRSVRGLWDPGYEDESWVAEPIQLIGRLRRWISENAPGLGISIGEYNFGAEQHMSGGLAVAEALGRFGEQGITSAFYWDYPPEGSPAFWAFRAYRNFDGSGGHFESESVRAESPSYASSAFASRNATGDHMVVVLLNFDPSSAIAAKLDAGACGRVITAKTFLYSGGAAGFIVSPSMVLPPYSIAVLDLSLARER